MLDAVLEDACLHLFACAHVVLRDVLLGADNNGLGAIFAIDLDSQNSHGENSHGDRIVMGTGAWG